MYSILNNSILIAVFAYILIPIAGIIYYYRSWSKTKQRLLAAYNLPLLAYKDTITTDKVTGFFRFCGQVVAFEEPDMILVAGQGASVLVSLSGARLILMDKTREEHTKVRFSRWASISSIPGGSRIFVAGTLSNSAGTPVLANSHECPLIVVVHNVQDDEMLMALFSAKREWLGYWNPIALISCILGLFTSSVLLFLGGSSGFPSIRVLAFLVSALPIIPFAPPGIWLYMVHRRLEKKSYAFLVERSIADLHLQGNHPASYTLEQEKMKKKAGQSALLAQIASAFSLSFAVALNIVVAFLLLREVISRIV